MKVRSLGSVRRILLGVGLLATAVVTLAAATIARPASLSAQGQVREIELLMGDPMAGEMTFLPSTITVTNGETVKLIIKNHGRILHEIRADLFRFTPADVSVEGIEIETMGLREVEVPTGKEVEVQMTIRVSSAILAELGGRATYEFGCYLPGHYQAGMKGTIVVQES